IMKLNKDHSLDQVLGEIQTPVQTRSAIKKTTDMCNISLFSCFLSQVEPKKVHDELKDPSWVEAMQEELLQFKLQDVWKLVNAPKGKRGR
ncbi:MAG: hypothetical protein QXM37_03745, partial [Candidatus Bathyarchaeia archaeon]